MSTKDADRKTVSSGRVGESSAEDVDSRHAVAPRRISVSGKDGTPSPLFPTVEAATTEAEVVWPGLLIEHHHLKPLEFPESTADSHLVAMHFRPAKVEWSLGSHPQTIRMRRGSLDIVPRGTLLGGSSQDETEFLMLALDPCVVERVAGEAGEATRVVVGLHLGIRDPQIEYICLALKAELDAGYPSGRLYGDALAAGLAARLLGKYSAHAPATKYHNTNLPAYKLRRVTEYINDNLTENLTLAELATVAGMNPHSFSRAFKQSTGVPPHRYVSNCRVERAKALLADDELPLVEVGLSVGFQTQSHFTTLFHRLTGLTPKAFRDGM
ncbi:MAG TPA: AraC family transcriptional regulator [Pyrinomonadaceae bacterium]|nr:AraC family transcriptional regulator [Pyrinomonadaceae bacterium]